MQNKLKTRTHPSISRKEQEAAAARARSGQTDEGETNERQESAPAGRGSARRTTHIALRAGGVEAGGPEPFPWRGHMPTARTSHLFSGGAPGAEVGARAFSPVPPWSVLYLRTLSFHAH